MLIVGGWGVGARAGFARKYDFLDIEGCGRKFSEGMGRTRQ